MNIAADVAWVSSESAWSWLNVDLWLIFESHPLKFIDVELHLFSQTSKSIPFLQLFSWILGKFKSWAFVSDAEAVTRKTWLHHSESIPIAFRNTNFKSRVVVLISLNSKTYQDWVLEMSDLNWHDVIVDVKHYAILVLSVIRLRSNKHTNSRVLHLDEDTTLKLPFVDYKHMIYTEEPNYVILHVRFVPTLAPSYFNFVIVNILKDGFRKPPVLVNTLDNLIVKPFNYKWFLYKTTLSLPLQ